MLRLTISRPNSVGITYQKEFDTYAEASLYIERRCAHLSDKGWELSPMFKSSILNGGIEAVHGDEADLLLIQWSTITDCECCEDAQEGIVGMC